MGSPLSNLPISCLDAKEVCKTPSSVSVNVSREPRFHSSDLETWAPTNFPYPLALTLTLIYFAHGTYQ
jgi:hypothetical protein